MTNQQQVCKHEVEETQPKRAEKTNQKHNQELRDNLNSSGMHGIDHKI